MIAESYSPPRSLTAKLARRAVRRHMARPVHVRLSQSIVSFTFDDFPQSAATTGAAVLRNSGARGTYYAACGRANTTADGLVMFTPDDVARLRAEGHEIGCHTFSHFDCARTPVDDVLADMVRNADALQKLGMEERLISFAYPYGETTNALKAAMPARFTTGRGTGGGVARGRTDFAQLPAIAIFGEDGLRRGLAALDRAHHRPAWVIFFTHDVAARPGAFGTPTATLERLAATAHFYGMAMLPVHEAAARILAANYP